MEPQLRFPGFAKNWNKVTFGEITEKVGSGSTPNGGAKAYCDYGVPFIRSQNVNHNSLILDDLVYISDALDEKMSGSRVRARDVLLNITGASIGRSCVVPKGFEGGNVNQHVCIVRLIDGYLPDFFQPQLASAHGQKLIEQEQAGGGREGLNFQAIRRFGFWVPRESEQQKIADFLTSVDTRIQQLKQKQSLLQQYKKGLMQQLFSQTLRFKDDNGNPFPAWEEVELRELAEPVKTKNRDESVTTVLTNSATAGVVRQSDYFDQDVANAKNLGGYYVVSENDFVYNPRISATAPVGPVNRNKLQCGVMSPLYSVFRFGDVNAVFYEQYFKTSFWHGYMNSVANFGARHDRMNITTTDFYGLPLPVPCIEEQTKIANALAAMDKKIDLVAQQIEQTQTFKKGLLQQMFV